MLETLKNELSSLEIQIENHKKNHHQYLNSVVKKDFLEAFNYKEEDFLYVEIDFDDNTETIRNHIFGDRYYLLTLSMGRDRRDSFTLNMSSDNYGGYHFSPSMNSWKGEQETEMINYYSRLHRLATEASAIHNWIYNNEKCISSSKSLEELKLAASAKRDEIKKYILNAKVNFITSKFAEKEVQEVPFKAIKNKGGRTIYTTTISLKKLEVGKGLVRILDDKNSTQIMTIDDLYVTLGGNENGLV